MAVVMQVRVVKAKLVEGALGERRTMAPISRSKRPSQSRWSRLYLIVFNAAMVAAWSVLLWNLAKEMVWGTGRVKPSTVLRNYAWDLVSVQSIEILESVHSLIGKLRDNC